MKIGDKIYFSPPATSSAYVVLLTDRGIPRLVVPEWCMGVLPPNDNDPKRRALEHLVDITDTVTIMTAQQLEQRLDEIIAAKDAVARLFSANHAIGRRTWPTLKRRIVVGTDFGKRESRTVVFATTPFGTAYGEHIGTFDGIPIICGPAYYKPYCAGWVERAQQVADASKAVADSSAANKLASWPKEGDRYFFVGWDGTVRNSTWNGSDCQKNALANSRVFATKKQAEVAAAIYDSFVRSDSAVVPEHSVLMKGWLLLVGSGPTRPIRATELAGDVKLFLRTSYIEGTWFATKKAAYDWLEKHGRARGYIV